MPITTQQLLQILPNAGHVAGVLAPALNTPMNRYQIVGAKRVAAFIAQIGHESGQLKYVKEIWGPTKAQLVTKAALSSATPTRATAQVSRPWPDPDHGPRQLQSVRRSTGPGPYPPARAAGKAAVRVHVGSGGLGEQGAQHPGRRGPVRQDHAAHQRWPKRRCRSSGAVRPCA